MGHAKRWKYECMTTIIYYQRPIYLGAYLACNITYTSIYTYNQWFSHVIDYIIILIRNIAVSLIQANKPVKTFPKIKVDFPRLK